VTRTFRIAIVAAFAAVLLAIVFLTPSAQPVPAAAAGNPIGIIVDADTGGSQFAYIVFHALDRDGFCNPPTGAVSLHPVLGIPVDFIIETGGGVIIETSAGPMAPARSVSAVPTFSTALNAASASPVRAFPPLVSGITDECQSWVKVSQSIPGPLRVLVSVASDDTGTPQFDTPFVAELVKARAYSLTLNPRWNLVTWQGADDIAPADALNGAGAAKGGSDIAGDVTALYAWEAATQSWRAYFPAGSGVPGANDLVSLKRGQALWIAVRGPKPVTWSIAAVSN